MTFRGSSLGVPEEGVSASLHALSPAAALPKRGGGGFVRLQGVQSRDCSPRVRGCCSSQSQLGDDAERSIKAKSITTASVSHPDPTPHVKLWDSWP